MLQLDPQEAQIAALKSELFLLRQENVWLRDQVSTNLLCQFLKFCWLGCVFTEHTKAKTLASYCGHESHT